VSVAVAHSPAADPRPRVRALALSDKEIAVLREIAVGRETDEIAALLYVSPHTVRTHVKNGMRKLQARNRAHAVAIALARGLIKYEPPPEAD
jgi:DNA-binding CsgD family transcriptional regulator